jgi:hypothetical protein
MVRAHPLLLDQVLTHADAFCWYAAFEFEQIDEESIRNRAFDDDSSFYMNLQG